MTHHIYNTLTQVNSHGWEMMFVLPEHDYVTFGSLLSQIRLSVVCRMSVTLVHGLNYSTIGPISSPLSEDGKGTRYTAPLCT